MTRSAASSIPATALLGVVLIGVPLWIVARLSSPLRPLQALDMVLLVALAGWAVVFMALTNRDDAVDSLTVNRTSPSWFAHQLVDNSLFGTGLDAEPDIEQSTATMARLIVPQSLTPDQFPSPQSAAELAWGHGLGTETASASAGVLVVNEPSAPRDPGCRDTIDTQEYIINRGDTFWSIAEVVFGDGRRWHELQDLNLGRQMAPGVQLTEHHELRIGWSILVPSSEPANEVEADHVV